VHHQSQHTGTNIYIYTNLGENLLSAKRKANGHRRGHQASNIIEFNEYVPNQAKRVILLPKTLKQEEYVDSLLDNEKIIVFATGPAGTGKTMLAVMAGIHALRTRQVARMVITRPAVGVDDEQHGFLPGDLNSKMAPWTRPIMDVIQEFYTTKEIAHMLEEKTLEIAPLAYMRGRNFKNSWIIFDEAQNATMNQMKMVLTRVSHGSRMIVTGDLNQVDRKFSNDNGLKDFLARLQSSDTIVSVDFGRRDVQRHPVVAEVLKLYGEY